MLEISRKWDCGEIFTKKTSSHLCAVLCAVNVYNYSKGVQGALLGTQTVNAGANTDVRINVGTNNAYNVLAVLEIDGQAVTSMDFDIVK